MEFFIFLLLVTVVFMVSSLHSKINILDSLVRKNLSSQQISSASDRKEQQHAQPIAVSIPATQVRISTTPPIPNTPAQTISNSQPGIFIRFFSWLAHDWPLKVGTLLFLAGFGWFASLAFMNNWIGPVGRIAFGLSIGSIVMIFGYWRIGKDKAMGIFLHLLGSIMVAITVYAARFVYELFTPSSAMLILLATSAIIASASAIHKVPRLAIGGLLLASVIPFLVNSDDSNTIFLFSYLFGVIALYLLLSWWQKNTELTITAFCIQSIYSILALLGAFHTDMSALIVFAYMFGMMFLIASTIGMERTSDNKSVHYIFIACTNALLLASWIYTGVRHDMQVLIYIAWCIVYSYIGFFAVKARGMTGPFYVNSILASVFLVLATMMQFSGIMLAAILLLESAAVIIGTALLTGKASNVNGMLFTLVLPILFSLPVIELDIVGPMDSMTSTPFLTYGLFGAILIALGIILPKIAKDQPINNLSVIFLVGALYSANYIWRASHLYIQPYEVATVISLVIYTIIGVFCYAIGVRSSNRLQRFSGTLILGLIVARLLLVDIVQMDTTGKVLAFTAIGALFIIASFISRKK